MKLTSYVLPEKMVYFTASKELFKRIFDLLVWKLAEYLSTKITIHLSPSVNNGEQLMLTMQSRESVISPICYRDMVQPLLRI